MLTAPVLTINSDGPDTVTGYVTTQTNPGGEDTIIMNVEVDLDGDGNADQVLDTFYDSLLDQYFWEYQIAGSSGAEDFDIGFRAVEWVGTSENSGEQVIVTISGQTNDAPVLQTVYSNEYAIWGLFTDDNLASGGVFSVEVSVTDAVTGFQEWGSADLDGTFYVTNLAGNSSGTTVLWVRLREISSIDSATSNLVQIEFSSGSGTAGGASIPPADGPGSSGGGEELNDMFQQTSQASFPVDTQPADSELLLSYWLYDFEDHELISLF